MTTATTSQARLKLIFSDPHINRMLVILAALLLFFAIVRTKNFLSVGTWQSMAVQFPEFGLMALGVMLTMLLGGIDLSVVAVANLSAILAAQTMIMLLPADAAGGQAAFGLIAAVLVALVVGALAGILNGLLVAAVKIPPILVTLGTFELFTGIAIVLTDGKAISGLPSQYAEVFAGRLFGVIPVPLLIFVLGVLVIAFLLGKTAYGAKIYLLGTNPTAAHFSGLHSLSLQVRTYLTSGMFAALAGIVMLANYNSARADYGASYTLLAILIVVLGGINPNGGSGRLFGVVLAVVILQVLSSLLNTFPDISNFYRPLIWGGVLLLVIVANGWTRPQHLRRLQLTRTRKEQDA